MIEFDVSGLIPYFVYMFRVSAFNAQGEGEALETKVPMQAKDALDPPEQPADPRIVDYDRKWVQLQWWAPSQSNIKHYIVEMQETFLVPKDADEEAGGAEQQQQQAPEKTEQEGKGTEKIRENVLSTKFNFFSAHGNFFIDQYNFCKDWPYFFLYSGGKNSKNLQSPPSCIFCMFSFFNKKEIFWTWNIQKYIFITSFLTEKCASSAYKKQKTFFLGIFPLYE